MKLNASFFLTSAALTLAIAAFFMPEVVEAFGHGDEMTSARAPLTPEQLEAKQAEHNARRIEREAHMQAALDLTDQQVAQIAAIKQRYAPQKEALRTQRQALREGGATRWEIKAAMAEEKKALREQINQEIHALLTPEQVEQMEALKGCRGWKGEGRLGRDD